MQDKKKRANTTLWLSSGSVPESGWVEILGKDDDGNVVETIKLNAANIIYTIQEPDSETVSIFTVRRIFRVKISG